MRRSIMSNPFGYVIVDGRTGTIEQHNLLLSADGHIHALWFNFAQGWHREDRSAFVPGVPGAVAEPHGYAFINRKTLLTEQHNLFRSADGHIHALWFNFSEGKWHHEDRSASVPGVPAAVGGPFGYTIVSESAGVTEQHNLFRSADGHVHALWFNFAQGWHHEDRSSFVQGVPAAVGEPFGYTVINTKTGVTEQHNLFRSADGHIHALWFSFSEGKWRHEDRSTFAPGVPAAVGDPFGYTVINEETGVAEQHNLFRSADGHIHALWFSFSEGKWRHEDRSTFAPGVPAAVGDPFGYSFISAPTGLTEQHNLFRAADGHIHALWFNFLEGKWHHEDRMDLRLPASDTATFDSGNVTSDLPLNGSVHLVMRRNGDFTFNTHAHDSGFSNIDYAISAVLLTASGIAFTFQHSGHVEGTSAGLPFGTPDRNDEFVNTGENAMIGREFDGIANGARLFVELEGKDKLVGGLEGMMSDLLSEAAQAIGKAAVAAAVALVV
jgi:hypothetical protein